MLKPQLDGIIGDESLSDFIISFATGDAELKHSLVTFRLLGDQSLDLVRSREFRGDAVASTLRSRSLAVEHFLHLLELFLLHTRGADYEMRRRGLAGDVRLFGAELPRKSRRLGALIQRLVVGARRRSLAAIGDVDFLAVFIPLDIGRDFGSPTQSELAAGLLGDSNTFSNLGFTVTDVELRGGLERLDGAFKFLWGSNDRIHTVVRVLLGSLCALWRLADFSQAVPRHAFAVMTSVVHYEQNAAVNTTLVQAFAVLIPYQSVFRHVGLLSLVVNCEHVVIEVIHSIVSVHSTPRNAKNLLRKLTVWFSIDSDHLILSMCNVRRVIRMVDIVVDFRVYNAGILKLDRGRGLIVYFGGASGSF
nr:MAG TPA: hypothetical protein [Caudoviricetes sp.]